jgi:DNA-binding transcriptional LysR family regulator
MDLDRLRTFRLVCDEGSVSRAAVRLFRTQPAISMQLAALEGEAGAKLLERTGRGVTPTAAGRRLLACAAELFRAEERLREAWRGEEGGGELRIAASHTVTRHLLPRVLRALVRRRPEVRLRLVESATPESQNRLHAGEVDVAFLLRPFADPRLAHEIALRYRHVAVYPPGRSARSRAADRALPAAASGAGDGAVGHAELASQPLVLLARGTQTRRLVDEGFRARGLAPERVLEVGSVSIQKELVRQGLGVGIVPAYAVEPRDRLRVRRIEGATLREVAAAWRSDLAVNGAVRDFLEELRALEPRQRGAPAQSATRPASPALVAPRR